MTVMKVTLSQEVDLSKTWWFWKRRLVALPPWLKHFLWTLKQRFLSHFVPLLAPNPAVIANIVINGLDFSTGSLWAWTCSGCCTGQDELCLSQKPPHLCFISWWWMVIVGCYLCTWCHREARSPKRDGCFWGSGDSSLMWCNFLCCWWNEACQAIGPVRQDVLLFVWLKRLGRRETLSVSFRLERFPQRRKFICVSIFVSPPA